MADAPPPVKEVPGQSNRSNTTQPTSCGGLVCELDRLARHERQRLYRGSWAAFSASPGELNIVGVRLKDSFSDRFDGEGRQREGGPLRADERNLGDVVVAGEHSKTEGSARRGPRHHTVPTPT